MAVSKVILNGQTIMDVTSATATAGDIIAPKTAMLANGILTTGTGTGTGTGVSLPYGDMEFITRETVSESVAQYTVDTDSNGLPFKLAQAQIILKIGTPTTSTQDYISASAYMHEINSPATSNGESLNYLGLPTLRLISAGATNCWFVYTFCSFNGLSFTLGKATATGNTQNVQQSTYSATSNGQVYLRNIDYLQAVRFAQYNTNTTLIPAGAEIIIYGCRYNEPTNE